MAGVRALGGLLAGAGTLTVLVAIFLPWRDNDLVGDAGLDMVADDTVAPLALTVLAVVLGCAATALTTRGARLGAPAVAALAAACITAALLTVPLRTIRAIGENPEGRTVEPEATDTLAIGAWAAIAGAVILLSAAAAALLGSRRH